MHPFQKYQQKISRAGLACSMLLCIASCTSAPSTAGSAKNVAAVGANIRGAMPELLVQRISWGINTSSAMQVHQLGAQRYLQQQLQLAPMTNVPDMPQLIRDQIAGMTISQKSMMEIASEIEQLRQASENKDAGDDARKNYQQELNRLDREAQSRAILRAI